MMLAQATDERRRIDDEFNKPPPEPVIFEYVEKGDEDAATVQHYYGWVGRSGCCLLLPGVRLTTALPSTRCCYCFCFSYSYCYRHRQYRYFYRSATATTTAN